MADNLLRYGFKFTRTISGGDSPVVEKLPLASAFRPTLTVGAASKYKNLRAGDPVQRLSTGYLDICAGQESDTPDTTVYGVIAGFEYQYSSSQGTMVLADSYPSDGISYGTNFERQTFVHIYPASRCYFEVCCDDKATATTYAAYLALVGENANHTFDTTDGGDCKTLLDISTHNTTATLLWRIVGVNKDHPENENFDELYVKVEVVANALQEPAWSATGV